MHSDSLLFNFVEYLQVHIAIYRKESLYSKEMTTIYDLSDDVLPIIFSFSTVHSNFFPSTGGPQSAFSRCLVHKSSIVQVCWRWNCLATPLLYESITLKRSAQFSALLQTLVTSLLGTHIVSLTFGETFYIPEDMEELFETTFGVLIQLCPRLKDIRVIPKSKIPLTPNMLSHLATASSITSLAFTRAVPYKDIAPLLLDLVDTIISLSVELNLTDDLVPLRFPSLKVLCCNVRFVTSHEGQGVGAAPLNWELPELVELHVTRNFGFPSTLFNSDIIAFCKKNGQGIQYLTLPGYEADGEIFEILKQLPKLEHLALKSLLLTENDIYDLEFPRIKAIEVINYDSALSWADVRRDFAWMYSWATNLEVFCYIRAPIECFVLSPVPSHINPVHVYQEAMRWIIPNKNFECSLIANSCQLRPSHYHRKDIQVFVVDDLESDLEDHDYLSTGESSDGSSDTDGSGRDLVNDFSILAVTTAERDNVDGYDEESEEESEEESDEGEEGEEGDSEDSDSSDEGDEGDEGDGTDREGTRVDDIEEESEGDSGGDETAGGEASAGDESYQFVNEGESFGTATIKVIRTVYR